MYSIKKRFILGSGEQLCKGNIRSLDEAKADATRLAEADSRMGVKTIYRVYEFDEDIVAEFDSTKIQAAGTSSDSTGAGSGGGQKSGASFKPSPLQTAPRPPGTPANNWGKPDDEEEKK
jgi:hypothetical protein